MEPAGNYFGGVIAGFSWVDLIGVCPEYSSVDCYLRCDQWRRGRDSLRSAVSGSDQMVPGKKGSCNRAGAAGVWTFSFSYGTVGPNVGCTIRGGETIPRIGNRSWNAVAYAFAAFQVSRTRGC